MLGGRMQDEAVMEANSEWQREPSMEFEEVGSERR